MKNIFKRLMNFLLIIFIGLAFAMTIKVYEKNELDIWWVTGTIIFFGVIGGFNYVFFGKFTLWNQKDESE